MTLPVVVAAAAVLLYLAYRFLYGTDTPHIKGLPEVPGLPLFGSLFELGTNHAKVAQGWAEKYGPVFQVRLGNRRIVFANTFSSVRHLWITSQSALISRPTLHTFHTLVSSSQGYTIGTSPWDPSCKARRRAAATALNRPAVQSYMPLIDLESTVSIKELLSDSKNGELDLDPRAYWQRIEGDKEDGLLKEITEVERGVSNLRTELKSIGLTMVSAGLDTVPGNLIMGIAYLACGPSGPSIQARALAEINKAYPDGDAWTGCLTEEKIPYVTALVKEILRFWTVIPICLPRVSVRDIEWEGVVIPAGTTFYMNAYAADYDPTHFSDPHLFNPDRYLADTAGTPHYAYGAGSRMCVGSHLANRELYTAFVRLICAFEFVPPKNPR
ncbi:hypothetical protein GRF29_106g69990 [Pseudopithomyces chartarum]|uniref:Cytochrome P450 n=1 Tax=Pseudopithomyces chartarum TaxID=1892770 RepID=A0AAN6LT57_9PLEO|nr:hypothetical protein GRF29_106g69990 [Pseudopithomyces chartarum]